MIRKDEFIQKSREVHGDKYDYSKVSYKKVTDKVCIICPIHGEFWQGAREHYRGQGCPKCGVESRAKKRLNTKEIFIEKARKIHGERYDYSKVAYINNQTKVCIICPEHGEFWQSPNCHLDGQGCPKCGNARKGLSKKMSQEEFIRRAKEVHGDKYDYSKTIYENSLKKVCVICKKHGEFYPLPYTHLSGHICPKCKFENQSIRQTKTTENFIEGARRVHGDKYDYSKTVYKHARNPVEIICPKHGSFMQVPSYHLKGNGCPKCGVNLSIAENEIYDYCKTLYPDAEQSNRSLIHPYELDIYIPELGIAIEYNGLRWHSMNYKKDKDYHLKKLELCKEKGIRLIQIFEDEYVNRKDIVFSKLAHILKADGKKPHIMGRKCQVKEIDRGMAKEFLEKYHIQGFVGSSIYLGAFYENELISVMAFKDEGNKSGNWELSRFASNCNYVCQGVGGRLFKYFIRKYRPNRIRSFADRRWTISEEQNLYVQLGFVFDGYTVPDYKYFKVSDGIIRQHKFGFRKEKLHKKYGLPLTMTETEMTEKLGYCKVYDCGLIRYVWEKEKDTV